MIEMWRRRPLVHDSGRESLGTHRGATTIHQISMRTALPDVVPVSTAPTPPPNPVLSRSLYAPLRHRGSPPHLQHGAARVRRSNAEREQAHIRGMILDPDTPSLRLPATPGVPRPYPRDFSGLPPVPYDIDE